jgi:adenine nucleotide transporter 17
MPEHYYSVMKSRLHAGEANALKHKSSLEGLLAIVKAEGVQGLYKGVGSKLLQSVLTAAILFAGQRRIYEMTKEVRSVFANLFLVESCTSGDQGSHSQATYFKVKYLMSD